MTDEQIKAKAIELINAYFDKDKTILVKDEKRGITEWTNIQDPRFWTYLSQFILTIDCYKIIDK